MATTTPAPYPPGLRRPLASKSRSQPASFSLSEPRRGAAYVRATGTDVPVFWDVAFKFTQADARRFWLWFQVVLDKGLRPFSLPLATEFGDQVHECRFLPDSLLPHSSEGGVHSYSATIMARRLEVPADMLEAGEMIAMLDGWDEWAPLLDSAVAELPELSPVLLLHFDGADGASTTTDAAGHVITARSATLSTAAARFGTASARMAGTSVCWQSPAGPDWNFGSGPFTVEAWVRFSQAPESNANIIGQWVGVVGGLGWLLGLRAGALVFGYSLDGDSSTLVGAPWVPALNVWHHIAADRDGAGTLRVYVNGAVLATAAASVAINASSQPLEIGGSVSGWAGPIGFIDEVRIVKGVAAFGGPFVPPAEPY